MDSLSSPRRMKSASAPHASAGRMRSFMSARRLPSTKVLLVVVRRGGGSGGARVDRAEGSGHGVAR